MICKWRAEQGKKSSGKNVMQFNERDISTLSQAHKQNFCRQNCAKLFLKPFLSWKELDPKKFELDKSFFFLMCTNVGLCLGNDITQQSDIGIAEEAY